MTLSVEDLGIINKFYQVGKFTNRKPANNEHQILYICIYTYIYLPNFTQTSATARKGKGNPLQYSCLVNLMDRRAWQARVHGGTKSQTRLSH